jgi:hypothetical protein
MKRTGVGVSIMKPLLAVFTWCLLVATVVPAAAADNVTGTFTVDGKATKFTHIYATLESDPAEPETRYVMLLVTDVPVPPADRTPGRLLTLAKAGRVRALRLRWTYGTDGLAVVPYHSAIDDSGRAFRQMSTINITKYDDSNIDAEFGSKALGQSWQFTARIKTAVANGGVATLEPAAAAAVPLAEAPEGSSAADAAGLKRQLGSMGYEFKPDSLFQAIGDRNGAAVNLLLRAGMSPNIKNEQGRHPLNHAVLMCGADATQASAIIVLLVKAKGDVTTRDPDNKTTPLVGATQSCTADAIDALIKAGSDLTAKSAGGMTALQLAAIFQRPDIAALLRKAGAK